MTTLQDTITDEVFTAKASRFEGYGEGDPKFLMLPQVFVRYQMQDLSEAELKVMLYIFDHTWGYLDENGQRKEADPISRSQFLRGVCRTDGTIIDRGSGISERSLDRALDGLVHRGFIFRHHRQAECGRIETNVYEINRYGEPRWKQAQQQQGVKGNKGSGNPANGSGTPNKSNPNSNSNSNSNIPNTLRRASSSSSFSRNTSGPLSNGQNQTRNFAPDRATKVTNTKKVEEEPTTTTTASTAILHPLGPASLRSSYPADLPLTPPGNLPDTKDNYNQKITKQNTQTHGEGGSGPVEQDRQTDRVGVCVSEIKSLAQANESGSKPKPKPELSKPVAAEEPVVSALAGEFTRAGIARGEARRLAALAIAGGQGPGYVGQALTYIAGQRAVKNPEGFLVHLVKTGWQPPQSPHSFQPAATNLMTSREDGIAFTMPATAFASATTVTQQALANIGPLPTIATTNPAHLPRLIEIETRNLAEARSDHERLKAQARLDRFRQIELQLAQAQAQPQAQAPAYSQTYLSATGGL